MAEDQIRHSGSKLWQDLQLLAQYEGVWRPNLLSLLEGELSELRSLLAIDVGRGLGAARRTIIASIHARVAQLVPRRSNQPLTPDQRDKQYKTVILTHFNVLPGVSALHDMNLTQRREWLAKEERGPLRISVKTGRRDFEHAIVQIEQMLTSNERRPVALLNDTPSESMQPALYVPRPALHEAFHALVQDGVKVIVFAGQPGMGKTWLARWLVRSSEDTHVPMIRIRDGKIVTHDVCAALSAVGLNARPQAVVGREREYLAGLLCGEHAPAFAILDNLDSAAELEGVLPTDVRSTVVATCRMRTSAPTDAQFIDVGGMTTPEATQAVLTHLPELSALDAQYLASSLQRHPLAIHHACALFRYQGSDDVERFCEGLNSDSGDVIGRFPVGEGRTLGSVLNRLCRAVRHRNMLAYEFIKYAVVWFSTFDFRTEGTIERVIRAPGLPVPQRIMVPVPRCSLSEEDARMYLGMCRGEAAPIGRLSLWEVLHVVQESSLMATEVVADDSISFDVHPLTAKLLLCMFEDNVGEIDERIDRMLKFAILRTYHPQLVTPERDEKFWHHRLFKSPRGRDRNWTDRAG